MRRDPFLARVRERQAFAVLPDVSAGPLYPAEERTDVVDWFVEMATAVGARIHHASSPDSVRETVRVIAGESGVRTFTAWDDDQIPVHGIASYLALAGLTEFPVEIPRDDGRARAILDLDRIHMGVTGADAAFARSGAVAVFSGPGRPRMVSLVPRVHVAVLPRERVYPSLSAWAQSHPEALHRSSNLVFIAGPSRSADIEFSLSIGVHGPAELHIVLA